MINALMIYKNLASLLDYPDQGFQLTANETDRIVSEVFPGLVGDYHAFMGSLEGMDTNALQELYVSTFDVKARCSLDIGHSLFGEDKVRNDFLIHLIEEHKKVENSCGKEMPDYLPNLLRLLSLSEDETLKEELSVSIMLPALRIMIAQLSASDNPYFLLLILLRSMIENRYKETEFAEYIPTIEEPCHHSMKSCYHG